MRAVDQFLAMAIAKLQAVAVLGRPAQHRLGTPSRQRPRNRDGLPSGCPGAKLARKAMEKTLTVRWP